jgi:thymidylate synthase
MDSFDYQYINLLRDILLFGEDKADRTGIGSRSLFGYFIRVPLSKGFPIITTRKVSLRIAFEETMFFLRGQTNTKILEDKKINIWKGNTSREFLDSVGLTDLPEGDMGKGYSYQWRSFGKDENNPGVDQIANLIKELKDNPNSRRHIVSAWNPVQLSEAALPPCHILNQYQVINGKLNSLFYMRSNDVLYGAPYNFMSYALLNHIFAKYLKIEPGILCYSCGDAHLYSNQLEIAENQSYREPFKAPMININKDLNSLDDILNLEFSDIELINYVSWPDYKNKPPMAV